MRKSGEYGVLKTMSRRSNESHDEISLDGPKARQTISVEAGQKDGNLTCGCKVLVFLLDTRQ